MAALAASPSQADDGGPDPQPSRAHPASNGRLRPGSFIIQCGRRTIRKPHLAVPAGVQPAPGIPAWFIVLEESGAFEAHALRRALASNEARYARPVHSPCAQVCSTGSQPGWAPAHACAGRESNPHALRHWFLGPAWLPVTPPALGADDGDRTRGLDLGKVALCRLSYVHLEPSVRFELTASALPRLRSNRWSYEGELY